MDSYLKMIDYLMHDFIGGPKIIQIRWVINLFKGLTCFYVVFLMYYFQNFSLGAYLYLALHGSYGMIWIMKDLTFPDKSWQQYITFPSIIGGGGLLSIYWCIGYIQVSGNGINNPTNARVVTAIFSYVFGVIIMIAADCQKYYTLKYKQGLITEGMFKYNRNPNYTGEMILYSSFAILTGNIISYCILITIWIILFFPFMMAKEKSFSKKIGWNQYQKQSYLIFWKIFNNDILNYGVYGLLIGYLWYDYKVGGLILSLKL